MRSHLNSVSNHLYIKKPFFVTLSFLLYIFLRLSSGFTKKKKKKDVPLRPAHAHVSALYRRMWKQPLWEGWHLTARWRARGLATIKKRITMSFSSLAASSRFYQSTGGKKTKKNKLNIALIDRERLGRGPKITLPIALTTTNGRGERFLNQRKRH